jgi:hypothetical protein
MAEDTRIAKLKEIFENTVESGLKYEGDMEGIDFYSLFCKAAANDQLFKMFGNNLCMFNYKKDDKDAILMIFSIPVSNPDEGAAKNVAERVMEVVREVEKCFVTLDYLRSVEIKEEKFVYVTAIKTLNGG